MKFRKMVSGLLACALVVTSVFTGNMSTVKAEGTTITGDAAEGSTALKAGDYYIMNTKTGKFLNAGNGYGTQASAMTYGQLVTVSTVNDVTPQDGGVYKINTHIKEGDCTYLGTNGYMNAAAADLTITSTESGGYTIEEKSSGNSKYLTASAENTVVTFADKSDLSEWKFLTRDEFMDHAVKTVAEDTPFDMSSLIFDPGFGIHNEYRSHWGKAGTNYKVISGSDTNNKKYNECAEDWHHVFDCTQTLEGVPNGEYTLSVQGFFRDDTEDSSAAKPVYYINSVEKPLMLRSDDSQDAPPNDLKSSAVCFENGKYVNAPISVEVLDNKIKFGVKAKDANTWVAWDNYSLKLNRVITDDEIEARAAVKVFKQIGEVSLTPASKRKIDAARKAYDDLTEAGKGFVKAEDLQILTGAEAAFKALIEAEGGQETFDGLAADEAAVKIGAIGTVDLVDTCKERIDAARTAYDVLTDAQKALLEEDYKVLTDAEARYQEMIPKQAALAAGDYYMLNNKTGRLFNGGNAWGTRASALDHGQLVTLSLVGKDTYHYYIDTHIQEREGNHFLDGEPYTDRGATPMVIVKTADGSYTIASPEGGYLTANDEDTTLSCGRKSEYSQWSILTREEYIEQVLGTFNAEHPTDVSTLIFDPKFSRCNTYFSKWDQTPAKGGDNGNNCAEKYNTTFNTSQTLTDIPNGTYKLSVQGFYRMDSAPSKKPYYYANDVKKDLMAIEDGASTEKTGGFTTERPKDSKKYVPNSMSDSSKCFDTGAYTNDAIEVTVTNHTLKIGVEAEEKVGTNTWVIWDNFTLQLVSVDDHEYSDRAAAKIDAIGEVSLTDECKAKIDTARAAYDKLTDAQKALLTDKLTVLTAAETKYVDLGAAAAVTEKIDAIGTYTFTTACKTKIDAAREAYDALTETQKALVAQEKKTALETAENSYKADWEKGGQEALNKADAAAAVALINAIGNVEFTEECKEKIDAAREAYDALIQAAKDIVTAEELKVLTDAEKSYKDLENAADLAVIASTVTPKIDAIKTVAFTSDSRLAIKAAREAYDALTDSQKELMDSAKLKVLTDAEKTYKDLADAGAPVLAAGGYYIVNVSTGKYLNASGETKATQSSYGQPMTVSVDAEDKSVYTIDTHYKEGTGHYLDAEGFLNGEETALKIEHSKDGNINIANADDQFLTASTKGTAITFAGQKSEASEWLILSREELAEKLSSEITEENPVDVTSFIFDPGFDKNNEYYNKYTYSDTLKALKKDGTASNVECFHEAFDFSQTIGNIPNGVYELSVQGFYRADTEDSAPAVYYMNDTEQKLKTIDADGKQEEDKEGGWSTERGEVYVPNSMADAAKCFATGAYTADPITVTVTNHTLKIGVKTTDTNNWVLWDSFSLKLKEVVSDQQIVADVEAKIDAIGTSITLTEECKEKIDAARKAYDALNGDQKKLVAEAKVKLLEDAEAEYERLRQEQIPSQELKDSLKDTIAAANADPLEEAAYSAESLQAYKDALTELKKIANKKDATKTEIEEALAAFKKADAELVVKEEYKPTDKQIQDLATSVEGAAKLKVESYVQDENWTAFQQALTKAQQIKGRPNATKAQVEKAMKGLQEAMAKLTPVGANVNKTALNNAIKAAEGLKEKTYTPVTWKAFKTALDAAKSISAKKDATQKEVDDAEKALAAKQKALKKAATGFTITDKKTGSKPAKIAAGKSVTLKAQAKPAGASSSVKWSIDSTSKKKKYATISSKGVLKVGKKAAGKKITVTATSKDGRGAKTTVKITVMKNVVTKVTLKAAKKSVKAGKSINVKATVKVNGKKANKTLTWKSSNTKFATVNSKGKVTAKKAGKGKTVTITAFATDGSGKKATIKIKITK